jgi:hypothetical protein
LGLRGKGAGEQRQEQQNFHNGFPDGTLDRFIYNYGTTAAMVGEGSAVCRARGLPDMIDSEVSPEP